MLTYRECVGKSVYEIFLILREKYGERSAFSWWTENGPSQVSYAEFVDDTLTMAEAFSRRGLRGKRVVISGRNIYETVVSFLGAVIMGSCAVMLNFDLAGERLEEELNRLDPELIMCREEEAELIEAWVSRKACPVLFTDGSGEGCVRAVLAERAGLYAQREKPDLEAPALMLMTSGSTGRAKWAVIPQRAFWPHDTSPYGDQVLILPLYHVAVISAIVDNICQGVRLGLSDMGNGIRDIGWFRPKLLLAVPLFLSLLVKRAKQGELNIESFEMIGSGGAPENPAISQFFHEMGIVSPSLYGATETFGAVAYSGKEIFKEGSVGRVGEWNEIRISEQGEILVKGSSIMSGYMDEPEETEKALMDGWFHTGDIGYVDGDGFLFITGRLKNIIILSNGENVSPEEIERSLSACSAVEEVVVRGENDILAAYLHVKTPGDKGEEETAREFIREYNRNAPTYYRIGKIIFSDEPFEKTASGKVKR